jgi:RNA-splicing ligase RtcB
MIEYNGKYTTAKVMIDQIDNTTAGQITEFINHEAFTNPIAIMPDCHAGKGAVIGFTMEVTDKVIPNVIGVDIGCGMLAFRVSNSFLSRLRKDQVDREIRKVVPFGTNTRKTVSKHFRMSSFASAVNKRLQKFHAEYQKRFDTTIPFVSFDENGLEDLCKTIGMDYDRCLKSVGTLGGGNHFIEVGKDETGDYWVTIHCGSRNFGKNVAEYWQKMAVKRVSEPTVSKQDYIQYVKNNFKPKQYQKEIAKYDELYGTTYVQKGSEYLTDMDAYGYMYSMVVAQAYAVWNRSVIMEEILDAVDVSLRGTAIETTHNFIDFDDWIIRKGAIRSYEGEQMVIPFNMEDGLLICEGKSNKEWNCSAPHGAGRVFSRSDAKRKLNLEAAKKSMADKGIYSSNIPLDECKDAYKSAGVIEAAIEPTATIVHRVKPVLNMKDK